MNYNDTSHREITTDQYNFQKMSTIIGTNTDEMHICLEDNGQFLFYPCSLTNNTLDFIIFINFHDTLPIEISTFQYKFKKMLILHREMVVQY